MDLYSFASFFNINKDVQYFQMNNSVASANFNSSIRATKRIIDFLQEKSIFNCKIFDELYLMNTLCQLVPRLKFIIYSRTENNFF